MMVCFTDGGVVVVCENEQDLMDDGTILIDTLLGMIDGEHGHTCDSCGYQWRHKASDFANHDEHLDGHMCARCGTAQFMKDGYDGY